MQYKLNVGAVDIKYITRTEWELPKKCPYLIKSDTRPP
jgi:hypothetical protein